MENIHYVVKNLLNIMSKRELNKSEFAEIIGFEEPKWNKISNGNQKLSVSELSIIAEKLGMREIDIMTWPDEYIDKNTIQNQTERFFVAFEVSAHKRDDLLKSVVDDKENSKIVSNYKVSG